jgi:hypothetical protein
LPPLLIFNFCSSLASKNKKPQAVPSGILPNWDQENFNLLPAPNRSRSSASAASWRSSDVDIAMDEDITTEVGGIPSDDEEIQHQPEELKTASGFHFRVRHFIISYNSILLTRFLVTGSWNG